MVLLLEGECVVRSHISPRPEPPLLQVVQVSDSHGSGANVTLFLASSEALSSLWVKPPSSDWRLVVPAPVAVAVSAWGEGTQLMVLKGVDVAGNTQQPAANFSWFVPLTCSATVPASGWGSRVGYTRNTTLEFSLRGSASVSSFQVSLDGAAVELVAGPRYVAVVGAGQADGGHSIRVWGVDAAGVVDAEVCDSVSWLVDTTPPVRWILRPF